MCPKNILCVLSICLALSIAVVESRVIYLTEIPLPSGLIMNVMVRNSERNSRPDTQRHVTQSRTNPRGDVPDINTRFVITGGHCPSGYVRYGTFCFNEEEEY